MTRRKIIEQFKPRIRVVRQQYKAADGSFKLYRYWMADYVEAGTRRRNKFRSKEEAERWAEDFAKGRADSRAVLELTPAGLRDAWKARALLDNANKDWLPSLERAVELAARLSPDEVADARTALGLLGKPGGDRLGTLEAAVRFALANLPKNPEGGAKSLADAVDEYMEATRRDGLREKSVESVRGRLAKFKAACAGLTVAESAREVDGWLQSLTGAKGRALSPLTLKHHRVILHGFYQWALDRGWIADNPAKASRSRRGRQKLTDEKAPGILTPETAEKVMRAAERDFPHLVPGLALALFCGLRAAEVARIEWDALNVEAGVLTVGPKVAKRRSIRVVDLQPVAVAWLAPHRRMSGRVVPVPAGMTPAQAWANGVREIRRRCGMMAPGVWPYNALRHSFASYHLAAFANANATALQLGHRDLVMLFNHYRGLVTPAQAATFWAIRPAGPAKVVTIGAAS